MPYKPRVPCQHPGCPELVEPGRKYCEKHRQMHPEAVRSARKAGYGRQWEKAANLMKRNGGIPNMKTGRSLNAVMQELAFQQKAKRDYIAPAVGMRLRDDGHTFEMNHLENGNHEAFQTTSLFHRQLASTLRIPAKYYDLRTENRDMTVSQ